MRIGYCVSEQNNLPIDKGKTKMRNQCIYNHVFDKLSIDDNVIKSFNKLRIMYNDPISGCLLL